MKALTEKLSRCFSLTLTIFLLFLLFSCNTENPPPACHHSDFERDGICDKCGRASGMLCIHKDENRDKICDGCFVNYIDSCTEHKSEGGNGECDYCGQAIICAECRDTGGDGKCDACGLPFVDPEAIILVKDGKVNFRFVISKEYTANATVTDAVDALIARIKDAGGRTTRVGDNLTHETECEIIIGSPTNRDDIYKLDAHGLGYNGYSITPIEQKVILLGGGGDAAVLNALSALEKDILGLTEGAASMPDASLSQKNAIRVTPDVYTMETVLIGGNDISEYAIVVNEYLLYTDGATVIRPVEIAGQVRELIYKKTGIWLDIVNIDAEYGKAIIFDVVEPHLASKPGFKIEVTDGNLIIECGFPNRLREPVMDFFENEIQNKNQFAVAFNNGFSTSLNVRDVKYSDKIPQGDALIGGAVGDGINDDFTEIKEIHDYANKWGHTVNAVPGATYYIGFEFANQLFGSLEIPVKTDVNWTGASFIIDDTVVPVEYYTHSITTSSPNVCRICGKDKSIWDSELCNVNSGGWHSLPLFHVKSDNVISDVALRFEGMSLKKDATNVGWEPGKLVLIRIYNSDVTHYIRYGVNENSGAAQQEVILVHPNGDIDESTPLHWDYDRITSANLVCVEDIPITLTGGTFTTLANLGPNYYYSYGRNVKINRSNVTFRDAKHYFVEDTSDSVERCPYSGFAKTDFTNNVKFENLLVTHHKNRYDNGTGALLGTYELGAHMSTNVSWVGIRQTNFFEPDGSVSYKGLFGSNYCKGFYFEDCFLTSMDAHCGVYNAEIVDSTFEHINFIGEGEIKIKNLTVYVDGNSGSAISLRSDYGSTWNGTVTVDGMDIRYSKNLSKISLFKAQYTDWWFGFETYLPHTVSLNKVKITKYKQTTGAGGVRTETEVGTNLLPLYLVSDSKIYNYTKDISALTSNGGGAKNNPYHGTKLINVTNCGSLTLKLPSTPQFKDMKCYIDGVLWEGWK